MYKSLAIIVNNVTAEKIEAINECFKIKNKIAVLPESLRSKETLEPVQDTITVSSVVMDCTAVFTFCTSSESVEFNATSQLLDLALTELFETNEVIVQTFNGRKVERMFTLTGTDFKEI